LVKRNFDVIEMHGTTIKKREISFSAGKVYEELLLTTCKELLPESEGIVTGP
jgi:hypothetical protein